jgi:hypothetical protein
LKLYEGAKDMANPLIPAEEQRLNPDQVQALDYRRQMGLVFQVMSGQFAIIATLLTWWIGQDLVYARPNGHTIAYYFCIVATLAIVFGVTGTTMRRGAHAVD